MWRIHSFFLSPTVTPPTVSSGTFYYLFKTQYDDTAETYVKCVTPLLKTYNSPSLHSELDSSSCSYCSHHDLVMDHLLCSLSCWHHENTFKKNSHIFINSVKFSAIYFKFTNSSTKCNLLCLLPSMMNPFM